jgi:protein-tyrosine phosphatase
MLDVELYGGRGGFLKHLCARTLHALGAFKSESDIEWASVVRLVFVCKGNICRSPYASAKAQSLGVQATSFGLDAAEGARAHAAALENAALRGVDISEHRSARIDPLLLANRDLIIVFEPRQILEIRRRLGRDARAHLLGIWARPRRPHIQDPYGRSDKYFQQCFSVIDSNLEALVAHMERVGAPAVGGGATGARCKGSAEQLLGNRSLG